jgi:NAD(P)H-dependent FMN reductase
MLNVGIIIGSTREGRVSPQVASWVYENAVKKGGAKFEIIDLKSYHLPLLGESGDLSKVQDFKNKIQSMDAFIFIVSEYNHSIPASLKNAIDYLKDEWNNKSAGIVSYGSVGGSRAAEHLRTILGELQIADVRSHTALSMFTDFENWSVFKPNDLHLVNLNAMFDQVISWGTALKTVRK